MLPEAKHISKKDSSHLRLPSIKQAEKPQKVKIFKDNRERTKELKNVMRVLEAYGGGE